MGIKYIFNPTTGSLDAVSVETPAGADTEIQFNNAGVFGADSDLTWDDTSTPKVLGVGGDINLDDGGTYTTTLQTITPTAARTISFPDATGTVGLVGGSSGNLVVNQSGAYAGVANSSVDNATGNITLGSRFISSLNGAASAPPGTFTGTWFTGGTATTTKPQVLIEPTGATSTAWSTSGTGLGVNAASGFAGNLLDLQLNGTSRAIVTGAGRVGIGTSAPGSPLTIAGNYTGTSNMLELRTTAGGADGGGRIVWKKPQDEFLNSFISSSRVGAASAAQIEFGTAADIYVANATTKMVILGSGNVGIGTTSPSSLLHLADAGDITVGTTTGTKIGTATTQKLGFWDKTPVVQPTTGISGATFVADSGGSIHPTSTFDGYTIAQVVAALRQLGILA